MSPPVRVLSVGTKGLLASVFEPVTCHLTSRLCEAVDILLPRSIPDRSGAANQNRIIALSGRIIERVAGADEQADQRPHRLAGWAFSWHYYQPVITGVSSRLSSYRGRVMTSVR